MLLFIQWKKNIILGNEKREKKINVMGHRDEKERQYTLYSALHIKNIEGF